MQLVQGNTVIVAGMAVGELKFGEAGEKRTPRCSFSIYLGKDTTGNGKYANCVAWGGLAQYCSGINERDTVLACGRVDEHEYQGKRYRTLNCDFVMYLATGGELAGEQRPMGKFQPVDDDELPF